MQIHNDDDAASQFHFGIDIFFRFISLFSFRVWMMTIWQSTVVCCAIALYAKKKKKENKIKSNEIKADGIYMYIVHVEVDDTQPKIVFAHKNKHKCLSKRRRYVKWMMT